MRRITFNTEKVPITVGDEVGCIFGEDYAFAEAHIAEV